MTQTELEPAPARQPHWSDGYAFLIAVLLSACRGTFEALGYRHPLRIPTVILVWLVTCAFLGLPTAVMVNPTWADVLEYGNWAHAAWLAVVVEVGGLFIFQLLVSGPRVSRARHSVPQLGIAALISRGEALYGMRIASDEGLKGWMERVKAWTALCERELSETMSAEAADTFRRPSVIQVYKHQQRFNETHNGWLDLLAKRLDALRSLSAGLRPRTRFVEDPDPRA